MKYSFKSTYFVWQLIYTTNVCCKALMGKCGYVFDLCHFNVFGVWCTSMYDIRDARTLEYRRIFASICPFFRYLKYEAEGKAKIF